MKKLSLVLLACAGFVINATAATNFAARVISYHPGVNFAPGHTNPAAVLGEPSRVNPYGDATDPFNPAHGAGQVLSIGEGGFLVVKLGRPIFDTPRKPFGLDFIIFGNTGFIVTNDFNPTTYEWIGTPATDGTTFGHNPGATRVSVSADGVNFVPLAPRRAPVVDGLFPTDGGGRFDVPVDSRITVDDLAGATLANLRALYAGSGGGAGYDIGWAHWRGQRVRLPYVRYIRIEVLSGKAEIDGLCATARSLPNPRR